MRQVSEALKRAASVDFLDLVTFGIQRHAEADRLNSRFIFVSEIYEGADRMSSRLEQFQSAAKFSIGIARDHNRACILLARAQDGWYVAEHAHCSVDDLDAVNAHLREIATAAAGVKLVQVDDFSAPFEVQR
ncbi:hypothetical protein [Bradyrhizobium sp. 192]|uniref:hypothetical protein n=1 Tax=Bradyrhizobium sp. 192 TaxID=2782660 RepID=UPI001FFF8425|nr:hypothetical protein [Bradyrhizobium sp. 192]UPJ55441.1 hypothetical protein IVB24_22550 [Bradyrhizobium sp. 192]